MVRQLPWKVNRAKDANKDQRQKKIDAHSNGPSTATTSPPPPPHRPTPRSPSTSPACAEPLKEEFMTEGVDHDDKYRMVEDEFLDIAGQFTRHLHAAEHQRLKTIAKSQNAETIQTISRPVTGEMTDLVRRRHAALDTASKQHRGIARLAKRRASPSDDSNTDDEQDLPREPPASLQGLMDSPRKRVAPLKSFSSMVRSSSFREATSSKTAATATIKRQTLAQPSSDSDSDDLDSQPPWRSKYRKNIQRSAPANQASSQKPRVRFSHPSHQSQSSFIKKVPLDNEDPFSALQARRDDNGEEDPFARSRARKRAREAKAQQEQGVSTSGNQQKAVHEVPSFFI
ncbi:hypothetical protein QBC38DRAFT_193728 [Podospora fimiseda]|uniref:Uncharacterized protein n=1 Tax=Podospora fimiseda TaxID=252190 RepID=A0AAN7H2S4_9PEZI|nr:hypothetical protein QBC38DRAFT_193728 [Podospora fimiseda]